MDKCYQYIILFLLGIIVYYFLFNNDLVEGFERTPVTSLTSSLKVNVLKRLNEGFRFNKGLATRHPIDADGLPVGVDIVYHETDDGNLGHYYVPPNDIGGFYSVTIGLPGHTPGIAGTGAAIPAASNPNYTVDANGRVTQLDGKSDEDPEKFILCSKNDTCAGFKISNHGSSSSSVFVNDYGITPQSVNIGVNKNPRNTEYVEQVPVTGNAPRMIYYKLNDGEELIIEVEKFKLNSEFQIIDAEYTLLAQNDSSTISSISQRLDEAYQNSELCSIPEDDEIYDYSNLRTLNGGLKNAILTPENFDPETVKTKIRCKLSPGTFATGVECNNGVVAPIEGACTTQEQAEAAAADSQKCQLLELTGQLQGNNIKVRDSMMSTLYSNYNDGFTGDDTNQIFSYLTCKDGYQGNITPSNIGCNSSTITINDPCTLIPGEVDNRKCLNVDTTKNNCSSFNSSESICNGQDGCYYGSDSDSQLTSLRSSSNIQQSEDSLRENLLGTVGGQNPGKLIPKSIEDETELRKQYGIYGELEVLRRELIKQNDLEIQKLSDSLTVATCESDNCGHGIKKGVTRMSIDIPNKMVNGLISSSAFNNQQMLQDIREMVDQEAASTNNNTTNTNTP